MALTPLPTDAGALRQRLEIWRESFGQLHILMEDIAVGNTTFGRAARMWFQRVMDLHVVPDIAAVNLLETQILGVIELMIAAPYEHGEDHAGTLGRLNNMIRVLEGGGVIAEGDGDAGAGEGVQQGFLEPQLGQAFTPLIPEAALPLAEQMLGAVGGAAIAVPAAASAGGEQEDIQIGAPQLMPAVEGVPADGPAAVAEPMAVPVFAVADNMPAAEAVLPLPADAAAEPDVMGAVPHHDPCGGSVTSS